jgi:hypothetical protein
VHGLVRKLGLAYVSQHRKFRPPALRPEFRFSRQSRALAGAADQILLRIASTAITLSGDREGAILDVWDVFAL